MFSQGGSLLRADLRGVVEEAFNQSELYIGAKILTPLAVPAKAGQYPTLTKTASGLLKNNAKRRGPGTNYSRTNRAYANDNYTCIEYGSEAIVADDQNRDISRFFDLESTETRFKYREVQLAHEIRVAAKVFDRATFNTTTAGTSYTLANIATFDLGLDIDAAKQQIQSRGETVADLTVVMSLNVFNRVRGSTRLQNRIRGTISTDSQLVLDSQALADALAVKEVIVAAAAYDTAPDGATASMTNIWGDDQIWVGKVVAAAGPQDYFAGGTGYTLFWQEDADIFQVESYRDESIRATIIRARQFTDEKIVLSASAQIVTTSYA